MKSAVCVLLVAFFLIVAARNAPGAIRPSTTLQGSLDGLNAPFCSTFGWARDPSNPAPITVEFYRDAAFPAGVLIYSELAQALRPDLPFADQNHGFDTALLSDNGLFDGQSHSIYAYAVSGTTRTSLNGSPKSIQCPSAVKPDVQYLDNGVIRVGIDLNRGGTITYFADSTTQQNIVDVHDLGREIQPSYYAGPPNFGNSNSNPDPVWQNWPWNANGAGDYAGNPATVLSFQNDGTTMYVKNRPFQWALVNVPCDCFTETWITLEGNVAKVRYRLTNQRSDLTQYPARDQEIPAIYTTSILYRLATYSGQAPFSNDAVSMTPMAPNSAGSALSATENWAALVNDSGWGLGLYSPGSYYWGRFFYGAPTDGGGPFDNATAYVAPHPIEVLDHNIVYDSTVFFILGTVQEIRDYAYQNRVDSRPDYQFVSNRQHWFYINCSDSGFPIPGELNVNVAGNDPQLVGPEGLWDAQDVPTIHVRAAFHTNLSTAQIFWLHPGDTAFGESNSIRFPIIPDGIMRDYAVNLSSSSQWQGKIIQLRFDPVDAGSTGDYVAIEYISWRTKHRAGQLTSQ
jgi:hypothetical protein